MPRVYHKGKRPPADAVYIGRPSKWGNPFVIGKDGNRDEVVQKYREWLPDHLMEAARAELRGKDLVCWCAPLPCHGHVLLEIANAARPQPAAKGGGE